MDSSLPTSDLLELRDNYARLQDRVAAAATRSGRKPEDVLVVAVTKYATPEQVRALVRMGHCDLGESRGQQLAQRAAMMDEMLTRRKSLQAADPDQPLEGGNLPDEVRWHMIGHLQRNKIKQVVPAVRLIHSVDTLRLAEELHHFGESRDLVVDILIQVNASGEPSKFGLTPPAVPHVLEQMDTMVHLRLRGLMTMAPYSDNPEDARPSFARTAELFHDARAAGLGGGHFNLLSMGMSGDFETAIEEGANVIRVGSTLFGSHAPQPDDDSAQR